MNPYIIIKENDIIKKELITNKFNELLRNELTICKQCGYDADGTIFDLSNPTFYRLIKNKRYPNIIFFIVDLLNETDEGTRSELEIIEFNRRKGYNNSLISILKNKIEYENNIYELKALILTPQSDHFTAILLNYENKIYGLKLGNYFYDGMTYNHEIKEINNMNDILKSNIIYLGIYLKVN